MKKLHEHPVLGVRSHLRTVRVGWTEMSGVYTTVASTTCIPEEPDLTVIFRKDR